MLCLKTELPAVPAAERNAPSIGIPALNVTAKVRVNLAKLVISHYIADYR